MTPSAAPRPSAAGSTAYGTQRLVTALHACGHPLTPNTVYNWLAGVSVPRVETAAVIARLSRGRVRPADIIEHRDRVRPRVLRTRPRGATLPRHERPGHLSIR